MSFGYSVGDVLAVIALANKVRKDFTGAPEQFNSIHQDVRSLSIVIQDAYTNVDQTSEEHAAKFNHILSSCQALLHKLEGLMSKWSVISDPKKGKTVQRMWKRLRWEPDEISDLRDQITSKIMLLNAFNDQATSHNVAKLVRRIEDDDKQAMLDWISPIDYIPQQNHLASRLQANSRRWLFESPEYQNWEKQKGHILFCPGDPGTGKTFTTAIVLETLQEQAEDNLDLLNTFVYCTYQSPDQDVHGLISSLFRNSLQQAGNVPDSIFSQCDRKRSAKQALLRDEIIRILERLYSSFKRVTLLVDALDEIPTEVSRPFIAELLKLQKTCQLNLFVTSRHIPEIQNQFADQGAAIMEIRGSDKDIHQFLRDAIFQLPRFVARDSAFQTEIIEGITKASSGMFLLAELHLRSLKNKKSPKALRSSLAKLSVGSDAYDSAYEDAMARVTGQGPESEALAKQALLIIVFAREPLCTEDLVYALSIEPESESIDEENVPDIEDVAGVCAGLIIVDKESNVVRLVHKSAQEYFERNQTQIFPRANETMARLCLKFITLATSISDFDKRVVASWPPFWRYADINWAYHFHCAEKDDVTINETHRDANTNTKVSDLHSVSTLATDLLARDMAGSLDSALYQACREGRHALVELLLSVNNYDLNHPCTAPSKAYDSFRVGYPLFGRQGDDPIIKEPHTLGPTASARALRNQYFLLIEAAQKSDDTMIKVLLKHGADANVVSSDDETALYIAARSGNQTIVSLLLDQPVIDPDCKCSSVERFQGDEGLTFRLVRWTPLLAAAHYGQLECVRLLLYRAQKDYSDEFGINAVCLAAAAGHTDVLNELLQWSDVKVEPPRGADGISALEMALRYGNEKAALALIPYSDANRVYAGGDRVLNLAAEARYLETVRQLLTRDVQVNAKGRSGRTVLHSAAMTGNKDLIELILSHPDIDINIHDDGGNTPLMELVEASDSGAMGKFSSSAKVLLSRPELHVNAQNPKGDTALLIAASIKDITPYAEQPDVFDVLFNHPGIVREHRNNAGQTILVRAIMAGSQRVKTIVEETRLSHQFSEIDKHGDTLLSLAARKVWMGETSWEDIVKMSPPEFLYRKNSQGKTPEEVQKAERRGGISEYLKETITRLNVNNLGKH